MNTKLNKQVLAGLSLFILVCAVCATTIYYNLNREQATSRWVAHSREEIEHIESILSLMQDCEIGATGFVLTNEDASQEPFAKAIDSLPKVIAALQKLNRDDVFQQKHFGALLGLINRKIEFSHHLIDTRRQQGLQAAMQLIAAGSARTNMDSIRTLVREMLAHENEVLEHRKDENNAPLSFTDSALLAIISLFVLGLIFSGRKIWISFKEKKAAAHHLNESNDRFNFASKATCEAIWDWNLRTGKLFWGNNFELLFGYHIVNNVGDITFWEEHIHPEDMQRVIEGITLATQTDSKWQDEYRLLKADGTYAYVLDTAIVLRDEGGDAYRMTGSMHDITHRKEGEIKVQESEAKYRQIVESAQEGIWIINAEYCTVFVNKKMGEMLEYATGEMIGKKITDFTDNKRMALEMQPCTQGDPGCDHTIKQFTEIKFTSKSGKCIYASLSFTKNFDNEGNFVNGMAMVTNTTGRKLAEEKLQISEGRLRLLVDNIKDYAVFIIDTEGTILTWNMGGEKIKGYSADEIIGKNISIFYSEEQRKNKEPERYLEMAKQHGSFQTEGYMSHKNGSQFWADIVLSTVYDENKELYGFAKITRDVTEKRFAEKKIKDISDRLTLATNVANIGIWDWDLANDHFEWDETNNRLFGVSGQRVNSTMEAMELFLHPDDKVKTQLVFKEAALKGEIFETDFRVIWPDQSVHHIASSGKVQRDVNGRALRMTGVNMDITERRKAEEKEKDLRMHIQLLLDSASEGLYGIDNTGVCTFINTAGALMLGYVAKDCIGQNMHELIHYKKPNGEVLPAEECAISIATKANKSCCVDTEVFWNADGSSFHVEYTSNPIFENHEQKGAVVTFNNITDRKISQNQLVESERNLHAILFSTQEGLYLLDTNFRLVLMNKASETVMRRMSGKACKPGEDFLACFNPKFQAELLAVFERVLQGEQVEAERKTTEYGQVFYYSARYFPVTDENGIITNICCTSSDITEKKLAEEIINAANDQKDEYQYRFQSIVENSPQAVLIKNLEGYFTFINKSFIDAFGMPPEDVIGKRPKDIFTDPEAVVIFDADEEVLVERKIAEWEQEMTMRSGEKRHFQIIKFPVYDRKETLFGIGTICKDVTEIKNFQYNLIKAREKAENAERLQEQFLANMSHELRTPMNGIIGMANVLSNTELQPQQMQQLKIIQRSSDTLLNLINDILDLSKIKAGMLSIEKVDFDFNETIAATASVFKAKTLEKGIRFMVQAEPFIPRFLSGDPLRLTQILNNLLSNAIKFTEKGFVKLEASLLSSSEDDVVIEFIVSDTGIGIEQTSLEAIFNSFEQASSSISRKYGGTGLGLPITKRLIELQGGEITVESNPEKGSVFTFSLPYTIHRNNPVSLTSHLPNHISSISKKNYSGKHVLIAEDNEINQEVLTATLRQYKVSYTIANNGKEAVEQLATGKRFDLVFMDLRMPIMSGFQATAYIREKLQLQIPIVILTASVLRNEREKCISLGASDYMSKPINHVHLDLCLQRFLLEPASALEINDQVVPFGSSELLDEAYDISNLIELGDCDSINSVLAIFLKKFPQHLSELRALVQARDKEGFLEKSHKLRGSLTTIQIPAIFKLATSAERIVNDDGDWDNVLQILEKVSTTYSTVTNEVSAEIEQHILLKNTH